MQLFQNYVDEYVFFFKLVSTKTLISIIYMYGLNYHAGSSGRILPLKARCVCILQVQVDYGRGGWVTSPILVNRIRSFMARILLTLNAPANAASVLNN